MRNISLSLSLVCLCCSLLVGQKKLTGRNYISSSEWYSITFNGISFKQFEDARGKESVIAELSEGNFTTLRSDNKSYDWVTYYLHDSISRISVGFSENGPDDALELSHIELEGPLAVMNIMGVDISIGDPITKLGKINTAVTASGEEHFTLFILGEDGCCPVYIHFNPDSKKINSIGFYVPT